MSLEWISAGEEIDDETFVLFFCVYIYPHLGVAGEEIEELNGEVLFGCIRTHGSSIPDNVYWCFFLGASFDCINILHNVGGGDPVRKRCFIYPHRHCLAVKNLDPILRRAYVQ